MPRKSEVMQMDLQREFCATMQTLREIWDELGLPDEQMEERGKKVKEHILALLNGMVSEERELKKILLTNIENYRAEIEDLADKLNLPANIPREVDDETILQRDKTLKRMLAELKEKKSIRMRSLKLLKKEEQELCDQLCATPYYIASGCIPSDGQLIDLKEHIDALKADKARRWDTYKKTKAEIITIYNELDIDPDTTFAHELITEADDSFCLSTSNMDELKGLYDFLGQKQTEARLTVQSYWEKISNLWDILEVPPREQNAVKAKTSGIKPCHIKELETELQRLQEMKIDNLQKLTERARSDIAILWSKCYYSVDQRHAFTPAYDENYTETLLEEHEQELARLHAFYEENKTMFNQVQQWQNLFNRMLVLEENSQNSDRFANRGGNLLIEEKERKTIKKKLPRIEEKLFNDIVSFEQERNIKFLVEGIPMRDYVTAQWEAFDNRKETEKLQRLQKKKAEIKSEMVYGSTPKTPTKRRFIGMTTMLKNSGNQTRRRNGIDITRSTVAHSTVCKSPVKARMGTPKRPTGRAPLAARRINENKKRKADTDTASSVSTKTDAISTKSAPVPKRSHMDIPLSTTVVSADEMVRPHFEEDNVAPYCDFAHQLTNTAKLNKVRSSAIGDIGAVLRR